jgi:flagellar biogenesis protein FliO
LGASLGGGLAIAQASLALAAVVALALLAGLGARRVWPGPARGQDGALRLRATLALDARRRLHLLDTPGGAVLVLTGGTADHMLMLTIPGQTA